MFQYQCSLFNFSQILTKFSKNKEIIKQYKERVMLDMRRLVRQTKETGELERKYDAIVFILAS